MTRPRLDSPVENAGVSLVRPTYGGQAVIEGVLIRSPRASAVVVRRPDGSLAARTEHAGSGLGGPLRRVPLLRGLLVLAETIAIGMRALAWSSAIATNQVDERGEPLELGPVEKAAAAGAALFAMAVFLVGPALLPAWLDGPLSGPPGVLLEGALRLALLVGYIRFVGRSPQIRRVFQYHGAEHMAIQAYEHGMPLTTPSVRRFPKEHPRCGTSFLLTAAAVSMVLFLPFGVGPLWWQLVSRLLLMPAVAALAYEVIRLGGAHADVPLVRWLFTANLALQRFTTSVPDDEQIQVAIQAVERCIEAERAAAGTAAGA